MEIKDNDYIVYFIIDEEQIDLDQYISYMNQNKSNLFLWLPETIRILPNYSSSPG